jgi:hypothetical protein
VRRCLDFFYHNDLKFVVESQQIKRVKVGDTGAISKYYFKFKSVDSDLILPQLKLIILSLLLSMTIVVSIKTKRAPAKVLANPVQVNR